MIYANKHISSIVHKRSKTEPSLNVAYKLWKTILYRFLEIVLITNCIKLEFKVYHKEKQQKWLHSFYSSHSNKTNGGIFMDFFPS